MNKTHHVAGWKFGCIRGVEAKELHDNSGCSDSTAHSPLNLVRLGLGYSKAASHHRCTLLNLQEGQLSFPNYHTTRVSMSSLGDLYPMSQDRKSTRLNSSH